MVRTLVTPILNDSGANVSLISSDLVNKLKLSYKREKIKIQGIRNEIICLGLIKIPLTIGAITYGCVFHVMDNPSFPAILGLDMMKHFHLSFDENYKISQHVEINGQQVSIPIAMITGTDRKNLNTVVNGGQDDQINLLLSEFSDIFAKHKYDIGCISFEQC